MKILKRSLIIWLSFLMAVSLFGCGEKETEDVVNYEVDFTVTHIAEITIKHHGKVTVALAGEVAPITVENFVSLAESGFYDGLTFHRIIEGFMMQGGAGSGAKTIKGEFAANGVDNNIKHERGVISMARSDSYNSGSSQFFIMHQDAPHLNGAYAAFGKVVDGIGIVDRICTEAQPIDGNGIISDAAQPVIESIKITKK